MEGFWAHEYTKQLYGNLYYYHRLIKRGRADDRALAKLLHWTGLWEAWKEEYSEKSGQPVNADYPHALASPPKAKRKTAHQIEAEKWVPPTNLSWD